MSDAKAIYSYRSAAKKLAFQVVRYQNPKRFEIFSAVGVRLQAPLRPILYRLPELLASAKSQKTVYLVEGEKDADRLHDLGLIATTNPGGCRFGEHGWHADFAKVLKGRRVVILSDNDRPGIRRAEQFQRCLLGVAASVMDLRLPRLRRAEDVSDWLDLRGGSKEELESLVAERRMSSGPQIRGGKADKRRWQIFGSERTSSEKLVLLAVQHLENTKKYHGPVTADTLAAACSMHRVTIQNLLTRLRNDGILTRGSDGTFTIHWETLIAG